MSDLERELKELGTALVPEHRPIARRVAAQLEHGAARGRQWRPVWRRAPVIALAGLLAVAAGVAAVPSARSSFLEIFRLGQTVTVSRVDSLPPTAMRLRGVPGRKVTAAEARRVVRFGLVGPAGQEPDHVFVTSDPPGGAAWLVYGDPSSPRLLVTEFRGTGPRQAVAKRAGTDTRVEYVTVGPSAGIWLSGAVHQFGFTDTSDTLRGFDTRLAGNTLVWQRGALILRLEGSVGRAEAVRIARSFKPIVD